MKATRRVRVERLCAAAAFAAAAFACSAPKSSRLAASGVADRTTISDETGNAKLGGVCVATSIETCFDARDDNCNGLFDEGCGLPDGVLQVLIAWDEPLVDIDLEVFDPRGEPAIVGRSTALGLTKDRDCPTENDECGGQNVEVVTLDGDIVPSGKYLITLRLERAGQVAGPVTVRLGGHIGNVRLEGAYALTPLQPQAHLEIDHSARSL